MIEFRKKLQPLTELEQNYLDNKSTSMNTSSKASKKLENLGPIRPVK